MPESTYRAFDGESLPFKFYEPKGFKKDNKKYPCIVFFFGGGWMKGTLDHFATQAQAFADRGIAAFTPYYRTYKDSVNFLTSMRDGFYFLKHVSDNAENFSIDKDRVFLSGGSSGGHIALSCTMFNNVPNDLKILGLPLFNPVVDTSDRGYKSNSSLEQPWNPILFSPLHYVIATEEFNIEFPPMVLFYGDGDITVPYERGKLFCEILNKHKGNATLYTYPKYVHGFFNYKVSPECYEDTLKKATDFVFNILKESYNN